MLEVSPRYSGAAKEVERIRLLRASEGRLNLPILAADIVRRVKGSTDSAINLADTVASLIRAEMEHDRQIIRDSEALDRQDDLEAALRKEFNRDFRQK